jgi:Tfp pilus assembly protein FimV
MNFSLLIYWLAANLAWAEYRVFMIQMVTPEGKVVKEFPSTLDPLQYPSYYLVPAGLQLQYSKTWMCMGSTENFKKTCPDPAAAPTAPPATAPVTPSSPATPQSSPQQTP